MSSILVLDAILERGSFEIVESFIDNSSLSLISGLRNEELD